ncbi:MAG: NDP-sugar synthase [Candidatus Binataceae bacterium]|jgi:mannose-1-phosphate guanylyltransferase/phosphomannomutase
MQAVLLSDSAKSRLRPLTDTVPEPLLLVELDFAFDLLIKRLEAAGIHEIVVLDRGNAREIDQLVCNRRYRAWIQVLPESGCAGDAGALRQIECLIHGTFLVGSISSVFALEVQPLVEVHFRNTAVATAASLRPPVRGSSSPAGFAETGQVWPIKNPSGVARLIGSGPYMMEPQVLKRIPRQGAYAIATDLLPRLISDGEPVFAAELLARWGALDSLENYLECQRWFLRETHRRGFIHPTATVAPGVRLIPPFFVGPSSRVEPQAILGPDVVLSSDVVVGAGSRVSDSMIYPGVRIGARCSIRHSVVAAEVRLSDDITFEPDVIVGAGACIPSRSVLRAGARIAPNVSPREPFAV